jgi:hypothetical protein
MPPKASGSASKAKAPLGKISELANTLYKAVLNAENKVSRSVRLVGKRCILGTCFFFLQTLLQDELLELSGDEVSRTAVLQDINDLLARL